MAVAFARGAFTAIMGPSGSGKSTLMHCLAGLDTVSAGTIHIDDVEITGLSDRQLTLLRVRPQFTKVIEVRETSAVVGGRSANVGAITQRYLGGTIKPKVTSGSLDGLRPGAVVLAGDVAGRLGARVGRTVPVRTGQGTVPLRVAAILGGGSALPDVLLDESDFARHFDVRNDTWVFVIAKKGVSADDSRAAIDDVLRPYPMVKVRSAADIKAQFTKGIDQAFYLVAGLLALAILISLIGIANTLTLSVVERRSARSSGWCSASRSAGSRSPRR